jgi:glucose-1-phosphate cytidylyltransferase
MKTVILAGGYGTRLAEYTDTIPKPMVPINGKPLLVHIIELYARYGVTEIVVALGYKAEVIKEYFLKYTELNSDLEIDLTSGAVEFLNRKSCLDVKVKLVDTGVDAMTGARLQKLKPYLQDERFFFTYGDGIGDVNLESLLRSHQNSKKQATVTAVRPAARFGELQLDGTAVKAFAEKPQIQTGWINGGFFVFEPTVFALLNNDNQLVLEKEPLEKLADVGQLNAYKHEGFWQCMDTKRDVDYLNSLCAKGGPPWLTN